MSKERIIRSQVRGAMWEAGRPCNDNRYAEIYVACIRAGLSDRAALNLAMQAHDVAEGYTWKFEPERHENVLPRQLHRIVKQENAIRSPNGKDAEELAAEREKRASRWGNPEFHHAARVDQAIA
jgi:hypothetical protein